MGVQSEKTRSGISEQIEGRLKSLNKKIIFLPFLAFIQVVAKP